ncbi:MAG: hypothetical protein EOP60_15045 [Sphingomonadales bacterium]|nr:MAG: hypothetical protein EOP60_15045 [Sphingomonadales bacterium]
MDRVEQGDGVVGLVRLEPANEMELDADRFFAEGAPFGLRFLNTVLAEDALTRRDQGANRFRFLGFGDRDQRHRIGLAAGEARGAGDAGLNRFQAFAGPI